MNQLCTFGSAADRRARDQPFAEERDRYLSRCTAHGARPAALKAKRNEILWIAQRLGPDPDRGIGMTELMPIALERQNLHGAATSARRVIDIGRPWLRFLGWWRDPDVPLLCRDELDGYVSWMRDERGFTPSTVEQWGRTTTRFLRWCTQTDRQLGELTAGDIDNYVAIQGKGRWKRVSIANTVSALRAFLGYAAKEGWCSNQLAGSIARPRLYQQESLPYAPDWSVVQQMLADVDTNKPRDIREAANAWLKSHYIGEHNSRFAVAPEQEGSAFVADAQKMWREILCVIEKRTVAADNTVAWNGRRLQLPESRLTGLLLRATQSGDRGLLPQSRRPALASVRSAGTCGRGAAPARAQPGRSRHIRTKLP
jgi:hypothetical protein